MRGLAAQLRLLISSLSAIVVLSLGSAAHADTFTTELPELLGPIKYGGDTSKRASYDFHTRFSSVKEVGRLCTFSRRSENRELNQAVRETVAHRSRLAPIA